MKIWILSFDVNKYNMLTFYESGDLLEKIESFDGTSKINVWHPIRFKKTDSGGKKGASAFGSHISMPIRPVD